MTAMKIKGSRACGKMFSLPMAAVMETASPSLGGGVYCCFTGPLNW